MSELFTLSTTVSYWDVDRDQRLTLAGVFKLLQEAAIKHADQFGLGAKAMAALGESWVLNRVAASITRYPRYEEAVKVVTWSAGIRGFRGYRDLRVYCGEELVVAASSLWLYVNLRTKSLKRVPPELAERFPEGEGEMFCPELEKLRFAALAADCPASTVSLRYADFDGNAHLNNTAYFDCLQTALSQQNFPVRPAAIDVQFLKEVSHTATAIEVALAAELGGAAFAVLSGGELHAQGAVKF